MKTIKYIQFILLILFASASLIITGCGGNDVTSTNNMTQHDCGTHHTVSYGPFHSTNYTNTFVESGNVRVFQISAIPNAVIGNLCTHTEPQATASASWVTNPPTDTSYSFSVRLDVSVNGFLNPYSTNGTITHSSTYQWSGDVLAGLEQAYGNGPGQVIDIYVAVRFRSIGTLPQDLDLFQERGFTCNMSIQYDEYKASDHSLINKDINKDFSIIFKNENETSDKFNKEILQSKNNGAAVVNYPYTF